MLTEEVQIRINRAISNFNAAGAGSPSESILALMGEFAREGNLYAISELYGQFSRHDVQRGNLKYVLNKVPAIIFNGYWHEYRDLDVDAIMQWQENHSDWATKLTSLVLEPEKLAFWVNEWAQAIHVLSQTAE